ncbi:unnamed protein product, partial [Didymodactylos carnosus]
MLRPSEYFEFLSMKMCTGKARKNLPDDVKRERNIIHAVETNNVGTNPVEKGITNLSSMVIIVKDLIQQFKKRKSKSSYRSLYTAVDHLNFGVTNQSCFGLLGTNGAGKTTTFRMLVGELLPTSGEILISNKNIVKKKNRVQVGYCPQFDWLVQNINVKETLSLFARLHGLHERNIPDLCTNTVQLFGLDGYEKREVQKL